MSLTPLPASEVIARWADFDTVIDARSEAEFALDHLPDAVNWPTLNNAQRIEIGTLYKQVNPFEARKRGAFMAARNIAAHIERELLDKARDWKPLAYCWRGGQRSGSLALVLSQIGFRVTLVEGGYKAFRAALVQDTARLVTALCFKVICGPTGSGKTRLLQTMAAAGAQVLDLEDLAQHRSSVLGAIPGQMQPSQKRFETLIWDKLRHFNANQPIFVESESKKVGNLSVPSCLIEAMRLSDCVDLQLSDEERVALLLEDYSHLVRDVTYFCDRLSVLVPLKGHKVVEAWQQQAHAGEFAPVVMDLLKQHYDPAYLQSMQRNFTGIAQAQKIQLPDRSSESLQAAAHQLFKKCDGPQ
ncbi:tRNA 2-selenouridine(34) synthase MnmH [Rhodoferax sp.]|uniref:tRNA 2-selenouridine(34) synthase MnmH n=1 Tax=Rhodoferax sp. TaxID=50421 RepID=UPI00260E0DF0|nr:tRNA 2-selenouridine(34) synthase MnmH [Rhodoferax sp.]MDD4943282.1 tRNA 2-selenouridine(34) synthase MnmH [Rhodoferax sp.]MDD5479803.1 tRNA 2-selenouridine(34) synthase MnmH [Rhodoferax sp.]